MVRSLEGWKEGKEVKEENEVRKSVQGLMTDQDALGRVWRGEEDGGSAREEGKEGNNNQFKDNVDEDEGEQRGGLREMEG